MSAQIENITIIISGQKIELTLEDAKSLHSQLSDLFGFNKAQPFDPLPYAPWWPIYPPNQPIPVTTTDKFIITCKSN